MKTKNITLIAIGMSALLSTQAAHSQSAVDALQVTRQDFKGTARYMSMGGAFTALGGDLSAISLNPAGIGVYRSSEIGATLDIDFQKSKGVSTGITATNTQTKAYCNNFGYVGTAKLNSALQTFSWGVTYNRVASFDRLVGGRAMPVGTSLTNYISAFSQGIPSSDLEFSADYNPYVDSDIDWLTILGYSGYLINNVNGQSTKYAGLFRDGTTSDAEMSVQEKGYVDNYEFTFGGNISNVLFWGVGIGVNDLRYVRNVYYSESMADANVYAPTASGTANGWAEYSLYNDKIITGTGWNLSFGLIFKPIQELRIGASIVSPTWYRLDESYIGSLDYYMEPENTKFDIYKGTEDSDEAYFSWKLRSPWKFNVGAAAVIGTSAILSVDYGMEAYDDMTISTAYYDKWGYVLGYENSRFLNDDIREYTQKASNIRIGLEYRVTPKLSARLGYNVQLTNIASQYRDGAGEILTSGTDPSFSLDKTANYISAGLGYKFGNFYADATYVHKNLKSTLHPYTSYGNVDAPYFDVTQNNNSIVLSLGFKF